MEELDLDLAPVEVKVKLSGDLYTLREAYGDAVIKYRKTVMRGAKLEGGAVIGAEGAADAEPLLVAMCLYDAKGKTVPENIVRAWPYRVQKRLFDMLKEISPDIDGKQTRQSVLRQMAALQKQLEKIDAQEDQSKNMRGSTTTGSA